jgi:sugar/nucleoside kinase (ribokinase family)
MSIGDLTTDAFIRLKQASLHCNVRHEDCEICFPFGGKIPFEYVKVIRAVGNAGNAAVCAARLGLKTALVSNVGDDENGRECVRELERNRVMTSFVKVHEHKPTNYHFVLWYENDRTILVNHTEYDYRWPKPPTPSWIYLTSLAAHTFPYHVVIADYLAQNPKIRLAFQPGTFQLSLGMNDLKAIYARTDVVIVNFEEAEKLCGVSAGSNGGETSANRGGFTSVTRPDPKVLLKTIHSRGPKLVLITDSTRGAFMYDGDHFYHMPMYPDPRPAFERTGCGDAFSATFVSFLALGLSPLEALVAAPVNAMSVAQFVGSQEGLLSREQMEWWLKRAPADYKPREI